MTTINTSTVCDDHTYIHTYRAGLRGYVQFNKYIHIYIHTYIHINSSSSPSKRLCYEYSCYNSSGSDIGKNTISLSAVIKL